MISENKAVHNWWRRPAPGAKFPEIDEYANVEALFLRPDQLRHSRILPKLIDRRPRPVNTPAL